MGSCRKAVFLEWPSKERLQVTRAPPGWELFILLPNKRQCLEGPAGQSLSSAREMPPRVKAGAKACSPMQKAELRRESVGCLESGTGPGKGLPVQSVQPENPRRWLRPLPSPRGVLHAPSPGGAVLLELWSNEGTSGISTASFCLFQERLGPILCSWSHLLNHKIALPSIRTPSRRLHRLGQ